LKQVCQQVILEEANTQLNFFLIFNRYLIGKHVILKRKSEFLKENQFLKEKILVEKTKFKKPGNFGKNIN
jgi:hypothetical protein